MATDARKSHETLSLAESARTLLDECRMVLPGIQALFGFQLIAVFNDGFTRRLSEGQQDLHLAATALIAVAIAIIMTPAAFHRQRGAVEVTRGFLDLSTRLLLWSMGPLAVGICLELYLVAQLIAAPAIAMALAGGTFAVFVTLWFLLPRLEPLQRLLALRRD